jgi:hypothetical protein
MKEGHHHIYRDGYKSEHINQVTQAGRPGYLCFTLTDRVTAGTFPLDQVCLCLVESVLACLPDGY